LKQTLPTGHDPTDDAGIVPTQNIMTQEPSAAPQSKSVIEDDEVLGRYLAHFPSNRALLLGGAAVLYIVPVALLQVLFANVDATTASIVLITAFALLALGLAWFVLHHWNREIILYERGFSYREGSRLAQFYYTRIYTFQQRAERFELLRLRFTRYRALLITDQDEILRINNVYTQVGELLQRLEALITKARLPVVEAQLARGENIAFGQHLTLTPQGIEYQERKLAWTDYAGHKIEGKTLKLLDSSNTAWVQLPVLELDNILLLLAVLKKRY
jgi:hypothetical protein